MLANISSLYLYVLRQDGNILLSCSMFYASTVTCEHCYHGNHKTGFSSEEHRPLAVNGIFEYHLSENFCLSIWLTKDLVNWQFFCARLEEEKLCE